jgi:hypothetical protein
MKKKTAKKSTHDKAAEPVKLPRLADESKSILEAVTPKADAVPPGRANCKECDHLETAHYGSADRWCNIQGCKCLAFK